MAKINKFLKVCFISFTFVLAMMMAMILALLAIGHVAYGLVEETGDGPDGIFVLYVICGVSIAVSILGAYGGYKEKKWALIVFFIAMTLSSIVLLWEAVPRAIDRPQLVQNWKDQLSSELPLDEASEHTRDMVETFQKQLECCGVFNGYKDWGSKVPPSCVCSEYFQKEEKCETIVDSQLMKHVDDSYKLVYKQACFPVVKRHVEKAYAIVLGFTFGLAVVSLIEMVLSMVLICQIRAVVRAAAAAAPNLFTLDPTPPKYSELCDAAEN